MALRSHPERPSMRWECSRRSFALALLATALSTGCILSPQPDPPGANIVASASPGAGDVAVVGGAGSVPAGAAVRTQDADDDGSFANGEASDTGAFVLVVPSAPGHTLLVTYTVFDDGEWRTSPPRKLVVDRYDPSPDPLAENDGDFASPFAPGARASGGFDSSLLVAPPFEGFARLWCADECVQPGVRVLIANQDRGEVTEVVHPGGPFEQSVRASIGDVLLVFAVLAEFPTQTSSVVRLVVPAP
ncbi:MAG: hypothetical protein HY907_16795 [Deltaproteobacteria bacterium]|nr:hypothetical protein [Deltaproteobacteria bacterium]